jgi:hypothetical protein
LPFPPAKLTLKAVEMLTTFGHVLSVTSFGPLHLNFYASNLRIENAAMKPFAL